MLIRNRFTKTSLLVDVDPQYQLSMTFENGFFNKAQPIKDNVTEMEVVAMITKVSTNSIIEDKVIYKFL